MVKRWLDDEEVRHATDRVNRVVFQAVAHCVFQVWQKRRLLAMREHMLRRTGRQFGLHDTAALLGWEQTRAYEAARDLSDVERPLGSISLESRMWPRLRAVDELLALELLEIELTSGKALAPPPLGAFFEAAVKHFAALSPASLTRELRVSLSDTKAGDAEMAAIGAWLADRRKDPAVRQLGRARIRELLCVALMVVHRVAEREYECIIAKSRRRRRGH